MTNLERLIKAHVQAATRTPISRATEQIAEGMAREILKDKAFRARIRALIATHFGGPKEALTKNKRTRRSP